MKPYMYIIATCMMLAYPTLRSLGPGAADIAVLGEILPVVLFPPLSLRSCQRRT